MNILSILVIIFGILVVSSISTVYSILWLVATFITVSIILVFFDSSFVSLIYIIVYVGAIAILFLFVVQLLDLSGINYSVVNKTNNLKFLDSTWHGGFWILFLFLFFILGVSILFITFTYGPIVDLDSIGIFTELKEEMNIFSNLEYKNIFNSGEVSQVKSLAEWLYGSNLICLIIISVILLIAMIAPIYLCKS